MRVINIAVTLGSNLDRRPERREELANACDYTGFGLVHIGEVERNPYHVRMPAWMLDNVRRGDELIGGQGKTPPQFQFGTLYRIGRWRNGAIHAVGQGLFISANDSVSDLLDL